MVTMATLNLKSLLTFSVGLSFFFWIADSILNAYVFKNGQSLSESFFSPTIGSLWMRFSIITVVIIFYVFTKKHSSELQEQIEELEYLVTTDPTTLLFNKRKFYDLLEYEIEKDKRYKVGMSIIYCDVNDIDKITNNNNKDITEGFLRTFALQLVTTLRKSDIIARYDDEGFLILLPSKTTFEAKKVAEKILAAIEGYNFENIGKVTAILGITQLIENDNKITVVQRANDAFNKAKESGINNVEVIL